MNVGYETEMYTVTESQSVVELSIIVTDRPSRGALRPFTLSLSTGDNIAGIIPIKGHASLVVHFPNSCTR